MSYLFYRLASASIVIWLRLASAFEFWRTAAQLDALAVDLI